MDIKTIASVMYPYWIMGAFVIWATIKAGHKDALRMEKIPILKWIRILLIVAICRFFIFKYTHRVDNPSKATQAILQIPWPLCLTVAWEDALHTLPLFLLRRLIGERWFVLPIHWLATIIMMVEFGMGHLYQGFIAAALLSLYVPITLRLGKKYGFGTVMLCHTLYDLSTILLLKFLSGT